MIASIAPQPTTKELPIETVAQLVMAYHALDWRQANRMLSHPEGVAILALLCNAAAKEAPVMYQFKSNLIWLALDLASDWWATPHTYGDTYEADTLIYIENRIGRFAFHVKADDPILAGVVFNAPRSDRGWNGVSMQARARQIALDWLTEQASEERLPFDIHDQR